MMLLGLVLLLSPGAPEAQATPYVPVPERAHAIAADEDIDPDGGGCLTMHFPFTTVELEPEVEENFWWIYLGHLIGGETCGSAWVAPLMVGYWPEGDFFGDAMWTWVVHMGMYYLSYCAIPCLPCFGGLLLVNKLYLFPIASINTYNHHLKVAKAQGRYKPPPAKPERKKWIPPVEQKPTPEQTAPGPEKKPAPTGPPAAPGPAPAAPVAPPPAAPPSAAPPPAAPPAAPDSFDTAPGEAPGPEPIPATPEPGDGETKTPSPPGEQPALEDSPEVRMEAPADPPAKDAPAAEDPGFGGDGFRY